MSEQSRITWSQSIINIDKLKPYSKNPRIISQLGLDKLKESFDEIGYAQPININKDGTILSGHARYMQLKKEGHKEIMVMLPDRELTEKQEEAVVIRMNKNIAGSWDYDILANEFNLEELIDWGFLEHDLLGIEKIRNVNKGDENSEWVGMPEFETNELGVRIVIQFETEFLREEFAKKYDLKFTKKARMVWSTSWPFSERANNSGIKYE